MSWDLILEEKKAGMLYLKHDSALHPEIYQEELFSRVLVEIQAKILRRVWVAQGGNPKPSLICCVA